jgi:glutathione S-transferase
MTAWLTLEEALRSPGLRLAPVRAGVPSPWSEFARACFHVNRVSFSLVDARDSDRSLTSIKGLTGQETLPVVFWNEERPRTGWLDLLLLAERIAESPRLLPENPLARARIVGLIAELASEAGFGWHRRIMMIERLLTGPDFGERERGIGKYLAKKYRHANDAADRSLRRSEQIVAAFAELHDAGNEFLAGASLTALDLAWAAFAALIEPLPENLCPMSPLWRGLYTWVPAATQREKVVALLSRRERIYRECLPLPVEL